jgi:hypothetical protein
MKWPSAHDMGIFDDGYEQALIDAGKLPPARGFRRVPKQMMDKQWCILCGGNRDAGHDDGDKAHVSFAETWIQAADELGICSDCSSTRKFRLVKDCRSKYHADRLKLYREILRVVRDGTD